MSGVLPVFQSLPVLQATEKTVVLPIRQKSSKVTPFFLWAIGGLYVRIGRLHAASDTFNML